MKRSALCLVDTEAQADAIVGKLRSAGFSDNDISVLFPDKGSTRDFAHKKETKMPEGATVGASTGGVVGGTVGLLAGIGALAIPGLGPFIAAGPIMAALGGGAIGAGVGGLTGALVGLGIPEYEAKRYEGKVKEAASLSRFIPKATMRPVAPKTSLRMKGLTTFQVRGKLTPT
jgi:hypothetical protein